MLRALSHGVISSIRIGKSDFSFIDRGFGFSYVVPFFNGVHEHALNSNLLDFGTVQNLEGDSCRQFS